MIKLAIAMLLTMPTSALAAPYCLAVPGAAVQCMYYDGTACARDADRQNGECQINPREVHVPISRVGDYCMITPSGAAHCGYADGNSCARDARQQHGSCTKGAGSLPKAVPDPYTPNAGR